MNPTSVSMLITGGAGFVGSALARALADRSDVSQITIADTFVNGKRAYVPDRRHVALYEVDVRDEQRFISLCEEVRPTAVIHLAALHFIPYCNAHPSETMAVNVTGTQNVLEACRRFGVQRVVIASTVAVYPVREGANREDDPAGPMDIYGLSKWVNEKQLELFAAQTNARCAVARLSNVFGPRETNPHVVPEIVNQVLAGAEVLNLGNVKPKRDYIYVDDVADALLAIAQRNERSFRVYNVGTGLEYSVEELVEALGRICGHRPAIRTDPARVRAVERMHLLADRSRIAAEIGWKPAYDLESGLRALWNWAQEEGRPRE